MHITTWLKKFREESKQENPKAEQEKKVKETTVENAARLTDEEIIGAIDPMKLSLNSKLDKIEDDLTSERQS